MQKRFNIKQCDETQVDNEMYLQFKTKIWQAQLENFREIIINEDITDALIEKVTVQLFNVNRYDDELEQTTKDYVREPVKIMINSSGGELSAALSICSAIEMSKTPVHTVALGKALSAGFLILICGAKRYAQHYSTLMYHTGSSGYVGVITDLMEHSEYLDTLNGMIHEMVMKHTNISEEQLDDVFVRKTDWYFSIPEAIDLGVIDEVYGLGEWLEHFGYDVATANEDDEDEYDEGEEDPEETDEEEDDADTEARDTTKHCRQRHCRQRHCGDK